MATKVQAARIATAHGAHVILADGRGLDLHALAVELSLGEAVALVEAQPEPVGHDLGHLDRQLRRSRTGQAYRGKGVGGQIGSPRLAIVARVGELATGTLGRPRIVLERLTLPVGPVRLHFEPQRRLAPVVTLDLTGAAALAWTIISYDELEWDVAESLAAGTPVGRLRSTDWDASRLARNYAGTILLSPGYSAVGRLQRQRILGHELVHTLQYDQSYLLWGDPLDRLALRRDHPGGIRHHLDLGLQTIAVLLAQRAIPYESQPWEVEARLLSPLEPESIGDGPRLQTVAPY